MRVAKAGRAEIRWELLIQMIAGMTTTIEICAPVMLQSPPKESQLGQGGLLAEQLDEVVSLESTDCRNNEFVKINARQTASLDKQTVCPSLREGHDASIFQYFFSKVADRLGFVAA